MSERLNENNDKTASLIDSLTKDLGNPSESASWPTRFLLIWLLAIPAYGIASFAIVARWPELASLPANLLDPSFAIKTLLWLVAFVISARICYLSAVPFSKFQKPIFYAIGAVLLLAVLMLSGEPLTAFASDFSQELAFDRGPCGFFIGLTGVITGTIVLFTMRRAAASRISASGAWALGASGFLSSFFMNLICRHEAPAHVLLWHVLPIVLIVGLGTKLAKAILRD